MTRHYFDTMPPAQMHPEVAPAVMRSLRIEEATPPAALPSPRLTDSQMSARLAAAQAFVRSHTVGSEKPEPEPEPEAELQRS